MKLLHIGCLLVGALWASSAFAVPQCTVSNRVSVGGYPGAAAIPTGNDLLRPAGKAIEAEGQKLVIMGQVLDRHCKPVQEAVVELWQANPYGKQRIADRSERATPYPAFAGAGRTYTDMNGNFMFITAFPAAGEKHAPFVSIRIAARDGKDFSTALYFSDDTRNSVDKTYMDLSEKTRNDVTLTMQEGSQGELIGSITLVLPESAPYRTY